jgi:hypothetical protein
MSRHSEKLDNINKANAKLDEQWREGKVPKLNKEEEDRQKELFNSLIPKNKKTKSFFR